MVIFFFMAGLFCIFSDTANEYLIGWRKYVMGAVFIAYGVLRGLRIQKQLNQIK